MIMPDQIFRLFHINWVLLKHGLDEIILATHLFRPVYFLRHLAPWQRLTRKKPRAVRIRLALEDLGPIFVKFGQILSTRKDLLPDDIAFELAKLQDQVPPFEGVRARQLIETALQDTIDNNFDDFDATPLASASIAQVHTARLKTGEEVVIKVVRPDIEPIMRRDIALLKYIARLAQHYWKDGRRLRPVEVVREFEKTLFDELDLLREAANASQLGRNFSDNPLLHVPVIYWPLCRKSIMVMERIYGIPVSNIDQLHAANIDLKQLAERGVEIFFTQVFSHNFFHADMHPGNIFVSPKGQYMAVDFGIMGALSQEDQHYLAENFLAFFQRDYRRVAELHVESEWVPTGTRIDEFEAAIRTVCEPIFERPLKDISFGHLLLRLFQTAQRFDMHVQPQLVLLQKTLLNIEGLGRQLYPDLDLWQTAKPFLERWTKEQVGPLAFFNKIKQDLPLWSERFPEIPNLVHQALSQTAHGKQQSNRHAEELRKLRKDIDCSNRRTGMIIISATLFICSTLLYALSDGHQLLSWLLTGIGTVILAIALATDSAE
ncbi:MAG: ubiquinone biosynthesis regulatory protein kinase UbiB [Gammaproteobacteria bacterium]